MPRGIDSVCAWGLGRGVGPNHVLELHVLHSQLYDIDLFFHST